MIRVEGLSVNYGAVRALRDVTFEAPTGQITAVLGANGAGKTTLLRTISGLVTPKSGAIFLDETALVGKATENIARMGVAHVPEGRGVIEELTVEENLRLGAMAAKDDLAEFFELWRTKSITAWSDWLPEVDRAAERIEKIISAPRGTVIMQHNVSQVMATVASTWTSTM